MINQFRSLKMFLVALCLSPVMAVSSSLAADETNTEGVESSPWEVGTRITHVILLEDSQGGKVDGHFVGTFVGSISMLKEEQDYLPIKLFVQYRFHRAIAVGLSYDRFGAAAWDTDGTDGTAWMSGPLFYLSGRYVNDSRFTPYSELGLASYTSEFDKDSSWGSNRDFKLDDTRGLYAALGCEAAFDARWSADLYCRYVNVDVDGEYWLGSDKRDEFTFTLSHLDLALGVKYTF